VFQPIDSVGNLNNELSGGEDDQTEWLLALLILVVLVSSELLSDGKRVTESLS